MAPAISSCRSRAQGGSLQQVRVTSETSVLVGSIGVEAWQASVESRRASSLTCALELCSMAFSARTVQALATTQQRQTTCMLLAISSKWWSFWLRMQPCPASCAPSCQQTALHAAFHRHQCPSPSVSTACCSLLLPAVLHPPCCCWHQHVAVHCCLLPCLMQPSCCQPAPGCCPPAAQQQHHHPLNG